MLMRFLVDANLPLSSAQVFLRHGHEALHVRELGLGDAADSTIAALAQRERYLVKAASGALTNAAI